jgi:hypothetical protein
MENHSYEVIPQTNGFAIIPPLKYHYMYPIVAYIDNYGDWKIEYRRNGSFGETFTRTAKYTIGNAYNFNKILDSIVDAIYVGWTSHQNKYPPKKLVKWMKGVTGRSLNKRVYVEWERCLNSLNPTTREIHKKLFAVSCGNGDYLTLNSILKDNNPYVISDLLNYKASRIALLYEAWNPHDGDWINCFSPCGAYRTINRVVNNLPNGVPPYLFGFLKNVQMEYPIFEKNRMMLFLKGAGFANWYQPSRLQTIFKIIQRSTEEDVKNTIKFMWQYFPSKDSGDFRRIRDVGRVMSLLLDYPVNNDRLSMLGWAREAERYNHDLELQERVREEENRRRAEEHRLESEERRKKHEERQKILQESLTALPPIALPENPSIKFLDTFKAVQEEGKEMEHCVATYAERAVLGHCYLFHVEHNGVPATVEVSPEGFVRQSYSKRDKINEASEYAKEQLSRWGREIKDKKPIVRTSISERIGAF